MLYEDYRKKMQKVAAFRQALKRRRGLIIALLLTLTALLTGFLSAKGVVYADPAPPAKITYGQSVDNFARALFGRVSYEFCAEGSEEWTAVQPRRAGSYRVRAVSKRTFGNVSYGNEHAYQILPKAVDVAVAAGTVRYGDNPALSAALMFDDSISCTLFDYADVTRETTQVAAVKNAIVITDGQGEDVTDSYEINVVTRDITFTARPVTVTVSDATAVYDGTPLSFDGYEVSEGNLAAGDMLIATFDKSRIDAGQTDNTAALKVVSPQGGDVTARYDITQIAGTLTVDRRPIYIKTNSAQRVYDGEPLSAAGFRVSADTPLVLGHTLTLTGYTSLTDAGSCDNLLTFKITDGDNDVTGNYSFLFPADSMLTVVPRTVTVRTASAQKVYDSTPLTASGYTVNSHTPMVAGHNLSLVFSGSQTTAGESQNTVSKATVTGGGADVTKNYIFEYDYGTLMVSPRHIEVRTATAVFTYNGTAQTDESCHMKSGGLAGNDSIRAVADLRTFITDAGQVQNRTQYEITNSAGQDVSDSYVIDYEYGTLTVLKLSVVVQTLDEVLYYDGTAQSGLTFSVTPNQPAGQTAVIQGTPPSVTEIGSVLKQFKVRFFSGSTDVTHNYDISYIYGTLTMLPRRITVTTATAEFIYNGADQSAGSYTVNPSLALNHTARLTTAPPSLNGVGQCENRFEIAIYSGENNVGYNYTVEYEYGTLTVIPRPVTITTNFNEWVYDGQEHSDPGYAVSAGSLVIGHNAVTVGTTAVISVIRLPNDKFGGVDNEFALEIYSGSDNVTHNYDINYNYGKLFIFPREIKIRTNTNSWVYDGEEHSDPGYTVLSGALVSGHIGEAIGITAVTNVLRLGGETVSGIENYLHLEILAGEDYVTFNYDIIYVWGTLTILPRPITIVTNTNSWVYDGEEHFDLGYNITAGELVDGYGAVIDNYTTITNVIRLTNNAVGIKQNRIGFYLYLDGNDLTYNYQITYVYGTLKILPREVIIKPKDLSKPYDGVPLTLTFFTPGVVETEHFDPWLVEGHFGRVSTGGSQTEIGVSNSHIYSITVFYGDEDVSYNYDFIYKPGILEVYARPISIYPHNENKVYDGTALVVSGYYVGGWGLMAGHQIYAQVVGSQTEVGHGESYIVPGTVKITNFSGMDVTHYYDIYEGAGDLHVWLKEITVKTSSAQKPYDGTPLTSHEYWFNDRLLDGHTVSITVTGSRTEIGSSGNTASVMVEDENGNNVTASYHINYDLGRLTVTGYTGVDLDGKIDLEAEAQVNPDEIQFTATADTDGMAYFRLRSFGDYDLNGWSQAQPFPSGSINPLFLMYAALNESGKQSSVMLIEPAFANLVYISPYYASHYYNSLSDVSIDEVLGTPYYIDYIQYSYNTADNLSVKGSGYEAFEQAYYEYVKSTYLQLPATTRAKLLEIAAANNLNPNNPSVIADVAEYVQGLVKYDLNFAQYFGDVALYFFTQATGAICQHYATAATTMFRALGIPARYVAGYAAEMVADEAVEVTGGQAHAWVEVYIAGAGWLAVEVTGGYDSGISRDPKPTDGGGGLANPDGTEPGIWTDERLQLYIKPIDVSKVYDGMPLYAKNEIEGDDLLSKQALDWLKQLGYSYAVSVTGNRTNYGVSESFITDFVLYDAKGADVTEQLDVFYRPGRIRINRTEIHINLYGIQKYYDGTSLAYEPDDYWVEDLPDGLRLEFSLSGVLIDVGELKISQLEDLPYKIYDGYDNDVSDQYSLVFVGNPLRIDRAYMEFTTASASKTYDGKPLTSPLAWLSKGLLPAGFTYEILVTGTITDYGAVPNEAEQVVIFDSFGNNVTGNFNIKVVYGTLIVL